ncbi:hypothetical protein V6N13_004859 [Hibiscus sabdariffa]
MYVEILNRILRLFFISKTISTCSSPSCRCIASAFCRLPPVVSDTFLTPILRPLETCLCFIVHFFRFLEKGKASSIASQLQSIKSFIQTDNEPQKRPFTRPSILFNPKEAADIDIDTILNIGLSGLEILIGINQRFRNYNNDLFRLKSTELDRELMGVDDNNQINASISSYLRLLSGHLQLPASLTTLEYLIRRYKIHVYNIEDLVLCVLPYHDTLYGGLFFLTGIGIVNGSFWMVLKSLVHHLPGLLLCNNAFEIWEFWRPYAPIDIVKRIHPFVASGLQTGTKGGSDHKAGALMIVGLLANRVALSPKLINSLIRTVTEVAREDVKESIDLQWFRLSLMALISLVQSQSVDIFPKKALEILRDIRDIGAVLLELSKEFNINRFIAILLEALVDQSSYDDSYHLALISVIDTVPLGNLVDHIVSKMCFIPSSSLSGQFSEHVFKALQLDSKSPEDPAIVQPCVTVLQKLNSQFYSGLTKEAQGHMFRQQVLLFHNSNGDIQSATRDSLLRLTIASSTVGEMLDLVLKGDPLIIVSAHGKKKKKSAKPGYDLVSDGDQGIYFLCSLLDVLLLKKDISNRQFIVGSLFKLLGKAFSDEWAPDVPTRDERWIQTSGVPRSTSTAICYVHQTVLLVLDDIFASSTSENSPLKYGIVDEIDIKLLVDCARLTKDGTTRNHVFTLLSTVAKLVPNRILEHILDILMVIGESALSQIDSHSQHVFEDLISAVVPCWLSKTNNTEKLLQIFINILPEITEHRRLSIVVFLLRILGESDSLASLLVLLFGSLVSRKGLSCFAPTYTSDSLLYSASQDWEYAFAMKNMWAVLVPDLASFSIQGSSSNETG